MAVTPPAPRAAGSCLFGMALCVGLGLFACENRSSRKQIVGAETPGTGIERAAPAPVLSEPTQAELARLALGWANVPPDRHPYRVYLARLPSPQSRRTMATAAEGIARALSGGVWGADALPWPALRYQHTAAIRAALAQRYAPATANRALSCLRGILREAWRLGQMTAEEFHKAADLERIQGERLPKGRALPAGELKAQGARAVDLELQCLIVCCTHKVRARRGASVTRE